MASYHSIYASLALKMFILALKTFIFSVCLLQKFGIFLSARKEVRTMSVCSNILENPDLENKKKGEKIDRHSPSPEENKPSLAATRGKLADNLISKFESGQTLNSPNS